MTHVRQQVREAAATALRGNTAVGNDVYSTLVNAAERDTLPLIFVRVDDEESELSGLGGKLTRTATLVVSALVEAEEQNLDNELDSLAAEIESIIGGNRFSGLTKQTVLTETEFERSEGARPTAAISLSFAVVYHTDESDGESAL